MRSSALPLQLLTSGRPILPQQARLLFEGLFTTITNVNFDPETVAQLTEKVRAAKQEVLLAAPIVPEPAEDYDMAQLWHDPDEDRRSLRSFVLFGLRGMAAYAYHAQVTGYTDGDINRFFCTALHDLAHETDKEKLFQLVHDTGMMAYRVMELLDKANTALSASQSRWKCRSPSRKARLSSFPATTSTI